MYTDDASVIEYRRELGKRLRTLRDSVNLSQPEFGDFVGVPWRSYQNYETGAREPRSSSLATIAEKFNVRLEWLLHGTGEPFITISPDAVQALVLMIIARERHNKAYMSHEQRARVLAALYRRMSDGVVLTECDIDEMLAVTPTAGRLAGTARGLS